MRLYEIAASLDRVLSEIEHDGGYLTKELEDALNSLEMNLQLKVEDCLKYCRNLEAQIEISDLEIARLKMRKARAEKKLEAMDEYLLRCLGPEAKIETSIGKLHFRQSKRVEIEGEVPEQYLRTKTEVAPDKAAIKADLECGATIPGAKLVTHYSRQVR